MLQRLGFPSVGEHRRFVTAIAVDAVGSGVFMPVSMLYFLVATPLSLVQIGAAISIASAVSIPAGPVVGGIVDRVGAQRVLQGANVLQGLGFAAYLVVDSFTGVLLATILVSVGRTSFWGSFGATVAVISRPGERELWFGFLGALRNVGFALGGLAAGLAITIGTETAYAAIVVVNALSYGLAYVLLRAVPNTVVPHAPDDDRAHEGWGVVLRDHRYSLLVLTQAAFSMSMMALNFAMPIYATETLGLPGWVAGALFTLNTVMVGFGQGLLVRSLTGRVRNRVLLVANAAFGVSYVVLLGATQTSVVVATLLVLGGSAVYTLGEMLGGPVLGRARRGGGARPPAWPLPRLEPGGLDGHRRGRPRHLRGAPVAGGGGDLAEPARTERGRRAARRLARPRAAAGPATDHQPGNGRATPSRRWSRCPAPEGHPVAEAQPEAGRARGETTLAGGVGAG